MSSRINLRVMNHLIIFPKLRIFVFKRVKAMGTGRNDLFNTDGVKHFKIEIDHVLGQIFIAQSPCGFAAALFIITQTGKIDALPFASIRSGQWSLFYSDHQKNRHTPHKTDIQNQDFLPGFSRQDRLNQSPRVLDARPQGLERFSNPLKDWVNSLGNRLST